MTVKRIRGVGRREAFRKARVLAVAGLTLLVVLAACAPALAAPGDLLWDDQVFHSGVDGSDIGQALKVDAAGNPIIAATSATGATTQEILGWSYWPTGIWRWESHWSGSAGTDDWATDLALDGSGDVYMVGKTSSTGTGYDYVVLRYLNNGWFSRANYYNGPTNGDDSAEAVDCSAAGDCYVTGTSPGAGGDTDIVTLKIDSAGVQSWARRLDSPWGLDDSGRAIVLRGSYVYVAGNVRHPGHGDDIVLVKYAAATGARLWVRYIDDPQGKTEDARDVIATSSSVYVCGSGKEGAVAPGDAMIARYTSAGAKKWVKFFSGGNSGYYEGFSDMQRAPNGNVVVTGTISRPGTRQDMATVAYRTDGTFRWAKFLYAPGQGADAGHALDIDGNGRIYATGEVSEAGQGGNAYTVCYSPTGGTVWYTPFDGASSSDDATYDIEVSSQFVWATGASWVTGNGLDLLTIKYEK